MNSANSRLDLGRRLLAALLSYQYGLGMDYTLKKYVPQDIHPSWDTLGRTLLRGINGEFDAELCQGLRQ
jgi:hypothetical protein